MEDSGFIGLIYIKRLYDELVGYCIIVMLCFLKGTSFGNKSYFVRGMSDFLYKGIYTEVVQEWVNLFIFQLFDWVENFPFQYIIVMFCFFIWCKFGNKSYFVKVCGGRGVWLLISSYTKVYTEVAQDWVNLFIFQSYDHDWVINFPFQYNIVMLCFLNGTKLGIKVILHQGGRSLPI